MAEESSSQAKCKVVASSKISTLVNHLWKLSFFDVVAKGMLYHDDGLELPS
ncbi:hypothetical protein CDL15_Pgr004935 [Punica granatum]|uniref:Uncharacterized protein n=1 Tax=Punica granatum TaxID=22663 RepID=A0A218WVP2_PUNGR|nr:hypothetical protein CDL15_Pgr004935 [Punica granatum]